MTGPHANMIGLYYLPLPTLAHEVGSAIIGGPAGALRALQTLEKLGFCFYDTEREIVWVQEMARFQIDETLQPADTRVKGVLNKLKPYRECRFARPFYGFYKVRFNLPEVDWLPDVPMSEKADTPAPPNEPTLGKPTTAKAAKAAKATHPVGDHVIRELVKVWIEEWKKVHPTLGEPAVKWPKSCGLVDPIFKRRGRETTERLIRHMFTSRDPLIRKTDHGLEVLVRWENKLLAEMEGGGGRSSAAARINEVNRRTVEMLDGKDRPADVPGTSDGPALPALSTRP